MHAGFRGDLHEVAITLFILSQYQQMVVGIAFWRSAMVIFFADIKLAPDDGLDAFLQRLIHKLHRAVDVPVVSHSYGFLADISHSLDQTRDAAGPVQQRVIGMEMEMDEFRHGKRYTQL